MQTWLTVLITVLAPSGVMVTLIEKTRRENNRDHARNSHILKKIDEEIGCVQESVSKIDARMNDHIHWHLNERNTK